LTQLHGRHRPVLAGKIFPFCFITIACGAVSGFHALISSGTTPKMLMREGHARLVGYGSMLMESFVGIIAMVAGVRARAGRLLRDQQPGRDRRHDRGGRGGQDQLWGFPLAPGR
jgi:carbon starvation protein